HPDEKALIHAKANGDKAAEKRLTDAACYRVQCWAEYSPNSQEYLARYVSDTDAKDLVPELKWVDSQKVSGGKFDYTPMQRVGDFIAGQTDQAKRAAQGFVEEVKNLPRAFVNKMESDAKQKMSESPSDLIAQGIANGLNAVTGMGRGEPPAASPGAVLANPGARQAANASLSATADIPPNATLSSGNGGSDNLADGNKVSNGNASVGNSPAEGAAGKAAPIDNAPHNAANYAGLKLDLKTTEAANEVIDSLRATGQLPENYVTKAEAAQQGWRPGKALQNSVPGGQLGGDVFANSTNILPSSPGRIWYEADVGLNSSMSRSNQSGTRLLYSSDGLLYITSDHYKSVVSVGKWK
ncbi:ribonuclease domain-containing protein, partial [Ralstonia pseudosolanacearum]|uniref:ribonuclease domain-containing protein n=1 Tax=Ralstonia pseudosolanacearum TaxID=1310165 RepID=UPI003D037DD0